MQKLLTQLHVSHNKKPRDKATLLTLNEATRGGALLLLAQTDVKEGCCAHFQASCRPSVKAALTN